MPAADALNVVRTRRELQGRPHAGCALPGELDPGRSSGEGALHPDPVSRSSSMRTLRLTILLAVLLAPAWAGCRGQERSPTVLSEVPELRQRAAALLPDLVRRSGLELTGPVRVELRSREELVRYLRAKLDEDLPPEEAMARVDVYARFGLVPDDLDLRAILLDLYTEQVAGFYEPDSTTLFVLDDQDEAALDALLVHELVHAIQDQTAELDALADPDLGSDRATAAQAVIEGHATLVMLEHMTETMTGRAVDLAAVPDFARQLRPALEGMVGQFPALQAAPRVIREGLLFPYLEGAGFVQDLWVREGRISPFGDRLPLTTEAILGTGSPDLPIAPVLVASDGATEVLSDGLGRFELGIWLEDVLGLTGSTVADAWAGDGYTLFEHGSDERSLAACFVWDTPAAADAFEAAVRAALGVPVSVTRTEVESKPATLLRMGGPASVSFSVRGS